MKAIAVLGVALVIFQVAKADLAQEIAEVVTECSNKQKLDKKTVAALQNELEVPEDNAEYVEFFGCLSTTIGTVDENGNIVVEKLKDVLQEILKKRLRDVPDVDSKVQHIVSEAIKECRDTLKADTVGQSVIRIRNCIQAEFQKTVLH